MPVTSPLRPTGAPRFIASARRNALVRLLAERGQIAVSQIATELSVSEMTIRRDLDQLAEAGLVSRDHGGATLLPSAASDRDEPALNLRDGMQAEAKARIARSAARLVSSGQTIGLDTGSSVHRLAKDLLPMTGLRLFASNLRTAALLAAGASPVYTLGGTVRPAELSVYGATTSGQLRDLWLDVVFIGISGLTPDGLSDYSIEDGDIKRVFIERANQVIVLCDSSKFDRRSLTLVSPLADIDILVTDAPPPEALKAALLRADVRVIVADPT